MGLLHGPRPVIDAGVPVDVEEAERVRPRRGVVAGQRHDQVRGLACGGELAELAADCLDFRRPVQAQHPAQRGGRDPGGALGPRFAGQGQEHQGQQCRGQPVEPVLEPAVDLTGSIQQPGVLQGRHREQQPGQRIPGARREHRDSPFAQQAPPGQRPLTITRHRIRQHRNHSALTCVIIAAGVQAHGVFSGTGRGPPAGRDPAECVADAERGHPGRRGDPGGPRAFRTADLQ